MYYAWGTHPAFFIAMAVLCCALVVILAHVYLKNCGFRYKKRFEATQFGPRLLFSPTIGCAWQFWESLIVLLPLSILFLALFV